MPDALRTPKTEKHHWEKLFGWLLEHAWVALAVVVALIVGGWYVAPFAWDAQNYGRDPIAVDAIPDVGEKQQIVFTKWEGRGPRDIEDQITYPLTTALLSTPGVKTIRSSSAFGFSTIYLIFEDDVDFYWARSRLAEKLASLPEGTVPTGVSPSLGPDATALGQVFWYTLEGQNAQGESVGGWDLDELRSIQDWSVRFALQAVPGVSEVASVGGFVREYQVELDPVAMQARKVSLAQVAQALRSSNSDVGARTLEINRIEYLMRGIGLVQSLADLEAVVVDAQNHVPVRIADIGRVSYGPAPRRGALDDEGAPAVGGVVVARYRENPLSVIAALKQKIAQIQPGLPRRTLDDGSQSQVRIVPFYDRSALIQETTETLSLALYQELLITVIVVLVMLGSLRASLMISLMLPLGVAGAFILMKLFGVQANVMALAGVAIAIGTMVDIGIVFIENISRQVEGDTNPQRRRAVIRRASAEVAPAVLTSVLTTIVSFLPVLGLTQAEYRLFAPLALTKTFAMAAALLVAVVVLPTVAMLLLGPKGLLQSRERRRNQPQSRGNWLYPGQLRALAVLALGGFLFFGSSSDSVIGGRALAVWVVLWAILNLVRPIWPQLSYLSFERAEKLLLLVALTFALSRQWMPLGFDRGGILNLVFVGILVFCLVFCFLYFESRYPRLLAAVLRNKRRFALIPTALCLWGAMSWLGFSGVFSCIPEGAKDNALYRVADKTFPGLGREYMPSFDEGAFLYMPTTMPQASIGHMQELLSETDAAIAAIPEVQRVVGKIGRADTALDPAPLSMIETVIRYHPEYRIDDEGLRVRQWRPHITSPRDIWNEVLKAVERPGLTGAPVLMPISARIVMLQSGMRAPMGVKVFGPSLASIESFSLELEKLLKEVPQLRADTVFADRGLSKPYIEFVIDRQAIGRYGLSVGDVQDTLEMAVGGKVLSSVIEGRERYALRVRYLREERDNLESIQGILLRSSSGEYVQLSQLAKIRYAKRPQVIKSEDTFLTSYVTFDRRADVAEVDAVESARDIIEQHIARGELLVPAGVSFEFAGSYQNQVRSEKRMKILIPLALLLVFLLIYLQFRQASIGLMVFSAVLVAISGGFVLLWLYGQPWFLDVQILGTSMRELFRVDTVHLSVGVWVGFIALIGIATDDGVVMSTYLNQSFAAKRPRREEEVRERVLEAAVRRVRPCLMTTATTILALLPVISSQGKGADLIMPMALPCVGGMAVEVLTLFIVPVLYCAWEERRLQSPV